MWYILQVATGSEARMKDTLERFLGKELLREAFYPLYESSYKRGGARQIVTKVLFPGYLFLDTENIGELEKRIKDLTEFRHLLSTGKYCTPVSREEQEFLERHMGLGHTLRMSKGYMAGREVTITEGAFASYRGQLKYVDRHNRYGVMTVRLGERDVDMRFGLEVVGKESA
ncbi:MAG: hypothetical protein NC548_33190 [Lachnospiraceae bacterium]|nr:hypothetical protein [Lachnospiraceae bacterium]